MRRVVVAGVTVAVAVLTSCTSRATGAAVPVPGPTPTTGTAGPDEVAVAVPKAADAVAPCDVTTADVVAAALGPVSGEPATPGGDDSGCVWPLGSGPGDGFLVGYGVALPEVAAAHPEASGGFAAESDGNATWLWCDTGSTSVSCGAAIALGGGRTFVTGLVRTLGPGTDADAVLTELEALAIPLFRTLPDA